MPFVFLKLLWRGVKAPEYKARRFERFGFFAGPKQVHNIWFHAVSVGEVLAAEPIIRELQRRYPAFNVVVTTMTPTSSELIIKLFGDTVFHVYAPYDLPFMVKAFLRRVRPEFLVIMETELWPNMIHQARVSGCPVVIANARLSERSAVGYRRLRPAIGWMLNELSLVLCQYENDAKRFASLGIAVEKIHVTGSVKYDIEVDAEVPNYARKVRASLEPERRVWIAASTHEGEDDVVLDVHRALLSEFPGSVLVLVPRHPERFDSAVKLAEHKQFKVYRRTQNDSIPADAEVFVVDTMGELMTFFALSDIAFIGGSFVPVGGHNPIEPGALGLPVLIGPHVFNFEAICEQMRLSGGLKIVSRPEMLRAELARMMRHPELAKECGEKAREEVEAGRGAVARVVAQLAPLIEERNGSR